MLTERGRSSPSFVIAVVAVVIAVLGYGAWRVLRPDPYRVSEQIVRESRREFGREVRAMRRELTGLQTGRKKDAGELATLVDERAQQALRRIDESAEDAYARLDELDIAMKTHKNRSSRLDAKVEEAKQMVTDLAAEAKAKLRGDQ